MTVPLRSIAEAAEVPHPFQQESVEAVVARVRGGFDRGLTRPLAWRYRQLEALEAMLREGSNQLMSALAADLGKSSTEAWTTEIGFTLGDISLQRSNLKQWARPRRVSIPLPLWPGHARVVPEPKGVVAVLAPWNYPVQLVVSPVAAAIAAGNAVVAKPSELAPHTSDALVDLAARFLDPSTIAFVEGGADTASQLVAEDVDHIFFTGSTAVGRKVMAAAAPRLTPVTLELGGKSPALVASDANLRIAARRIVWGKYLNAGQTCVAPDYVLVERSCRDRLVEELSEAIHEFYGPDPRQSDDYGRIVSPQHLARLQRLLDSPGAGQVVTGGASDPAERYFAPTVLIDTDPDAEIMSEEIFGPMLPVLAVDSLDEAIDFVNARPKPLALYLFSNDADAQQRVIRRTSSGGLTINATILQLAAPDLPFGGVGESGMGAYHGQTGFDTFSHLKSVYWRRQRPEISLMYPPFSKWKDRIIRRLV